MSHKPRPPSMAHPDDQEEFSMSFVRRKFSARPPSAAHPDDVLATIEEGSKVKKANVLARMGGKVNKQIRKKHACERAFMCALAVSLLWLTSLVVAKEVTHLFIPTPTQGSVSDSADRMFEITKSQRSAYKSCAVEVSEDCTASFARDKNAEETRIRTIQNAIEVRLEEIKSEVITCSEAFIDTTDKLEAVTVLNTHASTTGTCGDTDFDDFLSNEALTKSAVAELESYKGSTDAEVNGLSDQIAARALYDAQFMDNKTNGLFSDIAAQLTGNLTDAQAVLDAIDQTFSEFMACVSIDSTYEKQDGTPVSCSGNTIFGQARSQFNDMQARYQELLADARAYRTSIEAKMANYQELYDLCVRIRGVLSASGFNTNLIYVSGVSLDFPDYLSSLVGAQFDSLAYLVNTPEEIYDDMVEEADAFMSNIYHEADLVAASNALYEGNTTALLQVFFDDYNPPYVNETLYNEQKRTSANVVGEVAHELESVTSEENGTSGVEEFIDEAQVNISEASAQLLDKADPREWSDVYSYSEDVFNQFIQGLVDVNDIALAFDYAYRILRSLMLIRKYWNISAINTPPADVRTKSGIAAGTFKAKVNPMQKIGNILTNPVFNIGLIILFLTLFGSAFYATYGPIYDEYTQNCVDKCYQEVTNTIKDTEGNERYNTTGNGTMLYRNAYALAEQYAFSDGDYIANTEIDSIGVNMELSCRDSTIDSISLRLNQDDRLKYYNTRAGDLIPKFEYLRDCVDFGAIEAYNGQPSTYFDELVQNPVLEECVRQFPSFEEYLETLNLQVLFLDRIYDCSQISPCDFQCSGPSESILRGVTFDSSCTMEWYAHAELLTFFCALLGYITTNLARMIFLNGVVKISWRHLSSHKFAIIASCREDGTMIYPEEVTEKKESFRKVIVRQLRVAIRAFERRGCAITLFGISLVVPWFAILITLRQSLAFDSDRICEF